MSHRQPDSEAALEEAALQLFQSLEWETLHAEGEQDGDPKLPGRSHQGEGIVGSRQGQLAGGSGSRQ